MSNNTWPNSPTPRHTAIIMDGNGRWAVARGMPRAAGHRAGAEAVGRVVEAAPSFGIEMLTLYAFSAANWTRPAPEVKDLFGLMREYLKLQTARCVRSGVRIMVIGRRDRLPTPLRAAVFAAEKATTGGKDLYLRLALDYSSRDSILRAAQAVPAGASITTSSFERLLAEVEGSPVPVPPVDMLVRSGGEQRLSDFLLWECAYAELVFTTTMWPEFGAADLEVAVTDFRSRDRRFGRLPRRAAG